MQDKAADIKVQWKEKEYIIKATYLVLLIDNIL